MTLASASYAAEVANYDRDGFAIFRGVIDADLLGEASRHIEWLMRHHPERAPESLIQDLMTDDPFWVRLASDSRLLDVAELFIGSDIALFASHYLVKPPFTGKELKWHQDAAFWPLEPMEVVTLWLAIDESTPDNGCVRVIPGTHRDVVRDMVPTQQGVSSARRSQPRLTRLARSTSSWHAVMFPFTIRRSTTRATRTGLLDAERV